MAEVLLGFGGNLGDPAAAIRAALDRLSGAGLALDRVSSFYRTPPWGPIPQPDYINACAGATTRLGALELLALTQSVETALGRERSVRFGPRTLDIDILAYDDLVVDEPNLTLPHPRLTERAFVLVPLAEIAPERAISGRSVANWLADVDPAGISRIETAS